jgi:hypothetical protein
MAMWVPKSYGDYLIIDKPTTVDNFSFMVEYQFGYMYMRYLMWNFVGRQNIQQGDTIIKTEIGSWNTVYWWIAFRITR